MSFNEQDSISVILGRPTDHSVTLNVLAAENMDLFIEYGIDSSDYSNQTEIFSLQEKVPVEIVIDELDTDTRYFYRINHRVIDSQTFTIGEKKTFHTSRLPGTTFNFAVHADPHIDEQSDTDLYKRCILNTLATKPDFLIDLGDNFMSDKLLEKTEQNVLDRHLLLRSFYDDICHSVPLYLVVGNHEAEQGWLLDGTPDNMAIWATQARKNHYPNPFPNDFYTGPTKEEEFVGQRENYYSWEWGNALFVVLDPFWYTTIKPGKSGSKWDWTLGKDQYNWLKNTLSESKATFKFVFCHHLVGGGDEGRGGIEYARFYEWGGLNADSTWGFTEHRPDWEKPIHQLLVDNKVTIFFHGHDHFYCKQELDGVIYQLVPQPSHPKYKNARQSEDYGYMNGIVVPNSGHLNVTVSDKNCQVDYIRAYLPEVENDGRKNGEVAFSYKVPAIDSLETRIQNENVFSPKYHLEQNHPNPFNPSTAIRFSLPAAMRVSIKIYNTTGRLMETLVDEQLAQGNHEFQWQPANMSSGIYFYTLTSGTFSQTKRMILLK